MSSPAAVEPGERRKLARHIMQTYKMSERQACRLLPLSHTVFRYEAQSTDATEHWLHEYNTIRPHEALLDLTPHNMLSNMLDFSTFKWYLT